MNGPCKDKQALIVDQVLGLLDPPDREALFEHIQTCPACAGYQQALRKDNDLLLQFGEDLDAALLARMERCVAVVTQANPQPEQKVIPIGRRIKMSTIIKLAVAAVVAVSVGVMSLLPFNPAKMSPLAMLASIHAAENALFLGEQTIYIRNDITVYPSAAAKEWGGAWLPMCSLKADGQFRFDQLKLAAEESAYTVIDQAWYDPPTGRFVRLLEVDNRIVFGNSYDGTKVYTAEWGANDTLQVQTQSLGQRFTAPTQPAEFFGLSAGMPSGLSEDTPDLVTVEQGTLEDGSPVQIYKVGSPGPTDPNHTYWLFRVRDDDHTVAEKVFVVNNETLLLIRRVLSEPTDATGVNWDMHELQGRRSSTEPAPKATVSADMVQMDVSVRHMVEAASFTTYMLKQVPAWIEKLEIVDLNVAGPEYRMFSIVGRARDTRHIVLVQSAIFSQLKESGQIDLSSDDINLVCKSSRGFEVWSGAPQAMAKTMLQSSMAVLKEPPSSDCAGYGIEAPDKTFIFLAVNGPMTAGELRELADSLVPASEYLELEE